jgi:glycosyltransferase involved in cell wall biosynthesis
MRVHHVAPHFYPDMGGVETQVLRLAEFLLSRGHEVVVHTSRRSQGGQPLPQRDTLGAIEIRRYAPAFRLGYYTTLFRPQIERADIVHLHGYSHVANDWTARNVRGRTPIVFSLHHGVAQPPPNLITRMKRALYDPLVGMRILRTVQAIVAASEVDRAWLDRRGLPRDRIHVIPTGLGEETFAPGDARRVRDRLELGRYILFVGRLHREKSLDHLLRAGAALREREVSVVLAGPDAGARRGLETLAASLGLEDRIRFLGSVDESTKRDLLAGCECLALPSFYEAQGITILEAWAQGRPVVASRVGGIPYLVRDGTDGLLYRWGDTATLAEHLKKLLRDRSLADAMGRAGRERALAEFRWNRIAPRFEEIYQHVAASQT